MKKSKKGLLLLALCGTVLNICACGAQNNSNTVENATSAETEVGSVNVETLKMREEPSADANIIGLLENEQEVTILGEYDEYYKVYISVKDSPTDTVEGYVKKEYIRVTP